MNTSSSPEPRLRLRLLGGCEFQRADGNVRLESVKTSALLAYLVLQTDPQPRHKLIGLLWGDLPEASARRNLRHALWNLRTQFDSSDHPPLLLTDQQTIQFNRAADVWLDVTEFERRAQREAELTGNTAQSGNRATLLREAMELYRGDLLEGFYVDDAPAFEEWLLVERERLRALAVEALHRLVTYYIGWGEYADGLDYARRLLAMEPWREEAHRQMMRLLALSGQRGAALAQYETCRRVLAEELNAEPSPETQALYESIHASQDLGQPRATTPARNLPTQATPFVGRATELAKITELIRDPDCRLLTLVGPGGIGKTRLAVRAAANAETFGDGIFFVPLVGVGAGDLVVAAIADALGFSFHGGESPRAQLLDHLRDKEMLLVLDNFEHLLVAADLLAEIIQTAPRIKILVTSRERLNLGAEWLFQVDGLEYPKDESRKMKDKSTPASSFIFHPSSFNSYSATQLFVQGARRVRLGFVLAPGDKPYVARFCRAVEGMPLAIELAATWVRTLTCQEIAQEIKRGLDFLATSQRDVPARHRSMRAVFEHSWQLLTEEERAVFKRLSVFRRGFRRDAAEQVASANLALLASLVDKSLLQRNPAGRYEMHELLRQYGAEKMSADENTQARNAHCHYFAEFLQQRGERMKGGADRESLDEIMVEMDNVRAAWNWMAQHGQAQELKHACAGLFRVYETRLHLQEGVKPFGLGVEAMRQAAPHPENRLVLAIMLRFQGRFCSMLGDQELAKQLLSETLEIARELGERKEEAFALNNLGILAMACGEYAQAQQSYQASLAIKRELGEPNAIAITLTNLIQVAYLMGEYAQGKELAQEAIDLSQSLGSAELVASPKYFLGEIARALENNEEARRYYDAALALYRELAESWAIAICLEGLACVAIERREYAEASHLAHQALDCAQRVGHSGITASCRNTLGRIACAQGLYEEAKRLHLQAIQSAWTTNQPPLVLGGLIGIAAARAKTGQADAALELLTFVINHPATIAWDKDRAARLRAELETQLTPEIIARAREKAKTAKLAEVAKKIVGNK
ncbi:MAG: tetratricopeptide repeat protein [Anaerolineales bacterium]|nr:tetratricopeptide repeat protein [Anaerolineales bacterium]